MRRQFTNLHIALMLHYYCFPEPYSKHDPGHANSRAVRDYRANLVAMKMLSFAPGTESGYEITDKGRAYVHALQCMPEPSPMWGYPGVS